ncbi:MAG: Hsp20/alpha crystallin family protein [Haloarculaceae archaeon]
MTQSSNPFDELERLFEQMERNFEDAAQWWENDGPSRGLPGTRSVRVDVEDAGEELVVTADLPGFERADIDLRVTDRTLRLEADHEETAAETEEEGEREFVRRERHRASVSRTVQLPESVETDGVSATYENGVLTVRMPKSEPLAAGTEIDIE